MALLYITDRTRPAWTPTLLENGTSFALEPDPTGVIQVRPQVHPATDATTGDTLLVRSRVDDRETWVLLTSASDVLVNGERCAGGCRALRDQDEIRVPSANACCFLSLARAAVVVPFPALDRIVTCPRCTRPIRVGRPAVQCVVCELFHHEDDEPAGDDPDLDAHDDPRGLRCWTYADIGCANCRTHTPLDGSELWSPEQI